MKYITPSFKAHCHLSALFYVLLFQPNNYVISKTSPHNPNPNPQLKLQYNPNPKPVHLLYTTFLWYYFLLLLSVLNVWLDHKKSY